MIPIGARVEIADPKLQGIVVGRSGRWLDIQFPGDPEGEPCQYQPDEVRVVSVPTHHHTGHPGEYRPFGYDTTWCSSCDRPIDRTKFGDHACRPDEAGRPCGYKAEEEAATACPQCGAMGWVQPCSECGFDEDGPPPDLNPEGDPTRNGAFG